MKTILLTLIATLTLFSCDFSTKQAGTMQMVTTTNNDQIEVYKVVIDNKGTFVYVSRFKDQPNVVTTTWTETGIKQNRAQSEVKANVTIYENDSIKVTLK